MNDSVAATRGTVRLPSFQPPISSPLKRLLSVMLIRAYRGRIKSSSAISIPMMNYQIMRNRSREKYETNYIASHGCGEEMDM